MTEHKPKGERRIPKSGEGRLRFVQGAKHALDIQMNEAENLSQRLAEEAKSILPTLAGLADFQQIAKRLADEDQELTAFLTARYSDRKHLDHIVATLRIFRLRRGLARLAAAKEALRLAGELLAPDPLVGQFVDLLSQEKPADNLSREELTGSPRLLDKQLEQTKARLHAIQAALAGGNGWIEQQYVKKKRLTEAASMCALAFADGKPIPEGVQISQELAAALRQGGEIPAHLYAEAYQERYLGPYLFYRWREDGHLYSICLSDVTVKMPERFRIM